jgi:hypothetical protein
MARYYSKRRKSNLSKVIKQGAWINYCGSKYWYGRDFVCCHKDGMCYDCAKELDENL